MRRKFAKSFGRMHCDAGGASAIEFAIVAPIFLILVFGIVIYGAYFGSFMLINHIAYEAARAAVAGLSDDERASLADTRANELIGNFSGFLKTSAITVTSSAQTDGLYAVTVQYQFDDLGLSKMTLLPLPPSSETATYAISHGGY